MAISDKVLRIIVMDSECEWLVEDFEDSTDSRFIHKDISFPQH